eukprot:COSAG05_NODE_4313_length_1570_cov_1.176751_1_plen_121_part_00
MRTPSLSLSLSLSLPLHLLPRSLFAARAFLVRHRREDIAKLEAEDKELTEKIALRKNQFALFMHLCTELEGITEAGMPDEVEELLGGAGAGAGASAAAGQEEGEEAEADSKPAKKRKTAS